VDFWVADGAALPFPKGAFGSSLALNVIDSIASPLDLLRSMRRSTRAGGRMLIAAPYDWSGAVTAPSAWIGGHSPRSPGAGSSERVLRALLTPGEHPVSLTGVRVCEEIASIPWTLRLHERAFSRYRLHALCAVVES
jgi:SAM-dependent methyltransferase